MLEKPKELFQILKKNKLISGSFIMVAGGFLGSLTNYIYHLVVLRNLGPKGYGVLNSLISLLYLLVIPTAAVSLVIVRYVSSFKGQKREKAIESFFFKINKKLIIVLIPILIFVLFLTPFVSSFLYLPSPMLYIWIALSFAFGFFAMTGKSFLQGLCRFKALTLTTIFEGLFRLILTIVLLLAGFGLTGAVFPFFAVSIFTALFSYYLLKEIITGEKKEPIPEKKEIVSYFFPVFITNIGLTAFITIDVILARHFLSANDAGLYSALSTLGKIIYFAAYPVIGVIFPLISQTNSLKKESNKTAVLGLFLIILILLACIFIFIIFPREMIIFLCGDKYLAIESFLVPFAINMSLFTISSALINIFLALKKIFPIIFLMTASVLQAVFLFIFHENIGQFVEVSLILSSLLLISLLLYYTYVQKKTSLSHSSDL